MCSEDIVIRARDLSKTYRIYSRPLDRLKQLIAGRHHHYGRDFIALADINFEIRRGGALGIVGNNGAGKSTLLQLICGTLARSSGCLDVRGRVAALLELGAGFNPEFSGRENVFLNAAVLGLSNKEIEARFDEIVDFSGICEFIDQPVKTYSSGMYVRLAFSIATSVRPDILVIDEALSVGDGEFARKSFDRIMALRDSGVTILFCSHSMYHIGAICDQALWLDGGRLKMLGEPGEVTRAYGAYSDQVASSEMAVSSALGEEIIDFSRVPAGQAQLVSVDASADGVSGKVLQLQAGGSTLKVSVTFRCDPGLPPPSIAFGLETISGSLVSSGSTFFDGVAPEISADGFGRTSLAFPNIPLMRGKYRLTIFLGCERSIHVYDHALYCVELEVMHGGIERGLVFLPHAWDGASIVSVSS